MKMEQSRIE